MRTRRASLVLGGAALSAAIGVAAWYAYNRSWLLAEEPWQDDQDSAHSREPARQPRLSSTAQSARAAGPSQEQTPEQPSASSCESPEHAISQSHQPATQRDSASAGSAKQPRASSHQCDCQPDAGTPAAADARTEPAANGRRTTPAPHQAAGRPNLVVPESSTSSASGQLARSPSGTPGRRPINTTVHHPPLDTGNSSSVLAASLQLHYPPPAQSTSKSLAYQCSLLCERHCPQLQDFTGELGDTIALDLACGAGGTSFELAQSFSHVLGIDADPMLVLAAKELKEHGQLHYQATDSSGSMVSCTARVPDGIDRDRVRFWHYGLPALPPKLQPLDAVLVADVQQRSSHMLQVLQAMPSLLKPQGVCVVVVPDASTQPNALQQADVVACMEGSGLKLVAQEQFHYSAVPGMPHSSALATVWRKH